MIEKIKKQSKTIFIAISIAILFGLIGSGYYYWWTGTPEYSVSQIKKAIETQDRELGMKYIDCDALFENFWTDIKSQIGKEIMEEADGLGGLGAMWGLQMIESMKPAIEEQFKEATESWFLAPEESKGEFGISKGISDIWQKNLEIKKWGNSVYFEIPNGTKIIFTKKEGKRYWVITELEGFIKQSFSIPENENINLNEEKVKDSRIISAIGQARIIMTYIGANEGTYESFLSTHDDMVTLWTEITANNSDGTEGIHGGTEPQGACIWSQLNAKASYWYCADSRGVAGFTEIDPSTLCAGGTSFTCPVVTS